MQSGRGQDGVDKRAEDLKNAERDRLKARDRLADAFLAHLSQQTTKEVSLGVAEDQPDLILAEINCENKAGVFAVEMFWFGLETTEEHSYFLTPSEQTLQSLSMSSYPALSGGTLGEVVGQAVALTVDIMARAQISGARILTRSEAVSRQRELVRQRAENEKCLATEERNRRREYWRKVRRGCWQAPLLILAVMFAIAFFVGLVGNFVRFLAQTFSG